MTKRKPTGSTVSVPALVHEQIDRSILVIRGHKVLLDSQLASFYGVLTKSLVQAVKRNIDRFPPDFMFQLSDEEWGSLRSQFVTLKTGRGQHRKYLPLSAKGGFMIQDQSLIMTDRTVPSAATNIVIQH